MKNSGRRLETAQISTETERPCIQNSVQGFELVIRMPVSLKHDRPLLIRPHRSLIFTGSDICVPDICGNIFFQTRFICFENIVLIALYLILK